jgi:hypothetical protein
MEMKNENCINFLSPASIEENVADFPVFQNLFYILGVNDQSSITTSPTLKIAINSTVSRELET